MGKVLIFTAAICSFSIFASNELSHAPTEKQEKEMARHNAQGSRYSTSAPAGRPVERPYAEYETAKYLIMSSRTVHNTSGVKQTLAKYLPGDVSLILYHQSDSESALRSTYEPLLGSDRLKIVQISGNGFWSRDAVPVPVFSGGETTSGLGVVDAKYYHGFEPDTLIASYFKLDLYKHSFYFEGGNFVADAKGNCFVVNNKRTREIPDGIFTRLYGCQTIRRLEQKGGIGHIDERVKFLSDTVALTDEPAYQTTLENLGYSVSLLPKPRNKYETYVNSLLVNGTLFMPAFGWDTDAAAQEVYESHGLKVYQADSSQLSNRGLGSIHCITMTYPEAPLAKVLNSIGAR